MHKSLHRIGGLRRDKPLLQARASSAVRSSQPATPGARLIARPNLSDFDWARILRASSSCRCTSSALSSYHLRDGRLFALFAIHNPEGCSMSTAQHNRYDVFLLSAIRSAATTYTIGIHLDWNLAMPCHGIPSWPSRPRLLSYR